MDYDSEMNSIKEKVKSSYGRLNDHEYLTLMKNAEYCGTTGQTARDILATCKEMNWSQLEYVSPYYRNHNKEEQHANGGNSLINSGGCFVTTACLKHHQESFDDDCYELTTLRYFRDTYVIKYHPDDIDEYYRIGPGIVSAINKRTDRLVIYDDIYKNLVLKTITALQESPESAFKIYKDYIRNLKNTLEVEGGEI